MVAITSVIIIGTDPTILRLSATLQREGLRILSARSSDDLADLLRREDRYVAVLDGDLPRDEFTKINSLFRTRVTAPTLTLLSPDVYARYSEDPGNTLSLDLAAKATMPQEVVFKPTSPEELALRIKALILRAGYDLPANPSQGLRNHDADAGGMRHGKLVAVFSAKGGAGKSTIATHLAVGLSRFYDLKTLLVDTDLWFGDVGSLLDVHSNKTIFDLCSGGDPDVVSLSQAVVPHASGISVLLRPTDLVSVDKLDINAVGKILAVASAVYDYIVIDTRSGLDELTLQILDIADQILLITTPEVSAVGNASRFLLIAEELGYKSRTMLVVNRANTGVNLKSLERTLNTEVACTVVSAGIQVVLAANEGVPIYSKNSRDSEIFRNLASVVEKVVGRPMPKSRATGDDKQGQPAQQSLLSSLRDRWIP